MKLKNQKRKGFSIIYVVIYITVFLAFSAFAVDGSIIFTKRMKLQNITEATALACASEFNYDMNADDTTLENHITDTAEGTFNLLKQDGLTSADMGVEVTVGSKIVKVETEAIAEPFFLTFLGVNGIKIKAKASAVSEAMPITANYAGIQWVTASAAYYSDILSQDLNLNDTAILFPLGNFNSASYDTISGYANFSLLNSEDDKPLSLGPGGFVTIKLPAPIVNKPGNDLFIKEKGALEGYMVFAGLDNNPASPYVKAGDEGDGISWINISCSGTPQNTDSNGLLGTYTASTDNLGSQDKFYGSGYFDIGASCTGGISMAKYIRIVDDNNESAFVTDDNSAHYQAMLYGESSMATSGADIDNIKVLNHVRLIPST